MNAAIRLLRGSIVHLSKQMKIAVLIALTATAIAFPVLTTLASPTPRFLAPPPALTGRIKPSTFCASIACNRLLSQHRLIKATSAACPGGLGMAVAKGGVCKAVNNGNKGGFTEIYINPALQPEVQIENDEMVDKIDKIFREPIGLLEKIKQLNELLNKKSKTERECEVRFSRVKGALSPIAIEYLEQHLTFGSTRQILNSLVDVFEKDSKLLNEVDDSELRLVLLNDVRNSFSNLNMMKSTLKEIEERLGTDSSPIS